VRQVGAMGRLFDDDGLREITGEAIHLDMSALADDDRVKSEPHKHAELGVGVTDERTGAVCHSVTSRPPRVASGIRSAVRGDHDLRGRGASRRIEVAFADAGTGELLPDDGIVDEFTENGEGSLVGEASGLGDGVADAEAEAVVLSEDDFHWEHVSETSYFVAQSYGAKKLRVGWL